MIEKYSQIQERFKKHSHYEIMEQYKEITIEATFSEKDQNFIIHSEKLNETEKFILQCLSYQELFYILITIHNEFEPHQRKRYHLKNNFSILSSSRDTNTLTYFNNFFEFDQYIFNKREKNTQNMEGFYRGLNKIRNILNKNTQEDLTQ
ncbi:hypothetical protein IJM86_07705 [bacterium]|nr:hypothetical protein [bacterium]